MQLSTDHSAVQIAYTTSSEALVAAVKGAQAREAELAAARDAAAAQAAAAAAAIEALKKDKAVVEAERETLAKRTADLEGALLAKSQAHREEVTAIAAQLETLRRSNAAAATKTSATALSAGGSGSGAGRAAPGQGKGARGGAAPPRRAAAAKAATVVSESEDADFEPDIVVGRTAKTALAAGPPLPQRPALTTPKPPVRAEKARGDVPAAWATALQGLFSSDSEGDDFVAAAKGPVKRVRFSK